LLSAYAVDKLDPFKRKSNLDRDLIGKGIVNILCGTFGAYPIITEIVRSSANIENGAKTRWSNFFHGVFLLVFIAFFGQLINHIPLASLAGVLMVVGFGLAHPKHFSHMYHKGKDQFLVFSVTLIVTLMEDLLLGIFVGFMTELIINLIRGIKFKHLLNPELEIKVSESVYEVRLKSDVIFLGYLKVKEIFDKNEMGRKLEINQEDHFADATIKELIQEYKDVA